MNNEMDKEKALKKVNELILQCNQALNTKKQSYSGFYSGKHFVDRNLFAKCVTDINQFLNSHQAFRTFLKEFKNIKPLAIHTNYDMIKKYLNILENLKTNIESDFLDFDNKKSSSKINQSSSQIPVKSLDYSIANTFNEPVKTTQKISVFEELTKVIQDNSTIKNKNNLLELIREMEQNQNYKQTYLKNYQEFMALAENHMTIVAPFIPKLTQLLS